MNTSILRKDDGNAFFNGHVVRPAHYRRGEAAIGASNAQMSDMLVSGFLVAVILFVFTSLAFDQTGTAAPQLNGATAYSSSETIPWQPYPKH